MNSKKFMEQYAKEMKAIQESVLEFIENDMPNDVLKKNFEEYKIYENKPKLITLLHIISMISKYHFRTPNFFEKLEYIIIHFKNEILKYLANFEIFTIFKNSKRILLFLFEEKILNPELSIYNVISQKEYKKMFYIEYFLPEFSNFITRNPLKNNIEENIFKSKRKEGENDGYLAELIRTDSIDEFIIYINKNNISLTSTINSSIFETNLILLLDSSLSLIEYASFFGSFQIFKYLQLNQVILNTSLLKYAIHGKNPEIIHILESNCQSIYDNFNYDFLFESIKCHHVDIMNYINNILLEIPSDKNDMILFQSLKYHNFAGICKCNITNEYIQNNFINFINFDYYDIVEFVLRNSDQDVSKFSKRNILD
ncbi:hypothetical protein M9Y10_015334 [Tritrichomonas musculus]|uniref:DUF3447 domain-containing protein n=1 Tax=Tritrichomonas musculus TaxID=1915356 RepID=A0ABR2L251_9EUKA